MSCKTTAEGQQCQPELLACVFDGPVYDLHSRLDLHGTPFNGTRLVMLWSSFRLFAMIRRTCDYDDVWLAWVDDQLPLYRSRAAEKGKFGDQGRTEYHINWRSRSSACLRVLEVASRVEIFRTNLTAL